MTFKIAYVFILLDVGLLGYGFAFQDGVFVLNSQIAYFSALLVMIASFLGYRQKLAQSDSESIPMPVEDEREAFDKIGDKYEVFDDTEVSAMEGDTAEETEPKKRSRKERMQQFFSKLSLGGKIFFSIYRLVAYVFLIGGVLYLVRHEMWQVLPYIVGTTLTMVGLLISAAVLRFDLIGDESHVQTDDTVLDKDTRLS